jgi:hypothetical protein
MWRISTIVLGSLLRVQPDIKHHDSAAVDSIEAGIHSMEYYFSFFFSPVTNFTHPSLFPMLILLFTYFYHNLVPQFYFVLDSSLISIVR